MILTVHGKPTCGAVNSYGGLGWKLRPEDRGNFGRQHRATHLFWSRKRRGGGGLSLSVQKRPGLRKDKRMHGCRLRVEGGRPVSCVSPQRVGIRRTRCNEETQLRKAFWTAAVICRFRDAPCCRKAADDCRSSKRFARFARFFQGSSGSAEGLPQRQVAEDDWSAGAREAP
jgi:hypothetical protein